MRSRGIILMLGGLAGRPAGEGSAQDKPALHEMNDFMVKGAFTELDRDLTRHRLSPRGDREGRARRSAEAHRRHPGKPMALREDGVQVDEPLQVRGDIRVALTPNSTGDEAYTACFLALTYNGLVLSGSSDELILVRPETRPALPHPRRRWDRDHILSTRLFRLGYLDSDPILRRYHDEIGTGEGHAVLVPKSNVVIVTDTDAALEKLGSLDRFGDPGGDGDDPRPMAPPRPEGRAAESRSDRVSRVHPLLPAGVRSIEPHPAVRDAAAGRGDEVLPRGRPLDERARIRGAAGRSIDGSTS